MPAHRPEEVPGPHANSIGRRAVLTGIVAAAAVPALAKIPGPAPLSFLGIKRLPAAPATFTEVAQIPEYVLEVWTPEKVLRLAAFSVRIPGETDAAYRLRLAAELPDPDLRITAPQDPELTAGAAG